jgi:hypothetical protein
MKEVFEAYQSMFVPVIVGGAALITWISLRNESISKRARDLKQEWLKPEGLPEGRKENVFDQIELLKKRKENVSDQIELLKKRYEKNNKSLKMAIWAFSLFALFVIVSVSIRVLSEFALLATSGCIRQYAYLSPLLILVIGFVVLAVALWRMADEITEGKDTLFMDLNFPSGNTQGQDAQR